MADFRVGLRLLLHCTCLVLIAKLGCLVTSFVEQLLRSFPCLVVLPAGEDSFTFIGEVH